MVVNESYEPSVACRTATRVRYLWMFRVRHIPATPDAAILRQLLSLILRVFFRRVEVAGVEHVPPDGGVLFTLNHPNALVDPLLLMTLAPRPVAFLAKAPLFRMPVLGQVVRSLGAIPVHRRVDGDAGVVQNRQMFEHTRCVLASGGAIALFPEGTSHSEPRLRPFKTGAARIALGAAASGVTVRVVPAGLFYTAKGTFRSAALLYLGPAIEPGPDELVLDSAGDPEPEAVRRFTARIERAIGELTLQADQHDALAIATRAELIMTSGDTDDGSPLPLAEQLGMRRRLVAGYRTLQESRPTELARLEARVQRLERRLSNVGLTAETLNYTRVSTRRAIVFGFRLALYAIVVLPIVLVGTVIHYPAYRLIGPLAMTMSRDSSDLIATVKILAAALLFPITWLVVAVGAGLVAGTDAGIGAAIIAPATGFVTLRFLEHVDQFGDEARALLVFLLRPSAYRNLVHERAQLRGDIVALGRELDHG